MSTLEFDPIFGALFLMRALGLIRIVYGTLRHYQDRGVVSPVSQQPATSIWSEIMFTRNRFCQLVFGLLVVQFCVASAADTEPVRFDGKDNGRTAVFETEGPWMLDWSISSDLPAHAVFEMRLHDGASGDFAGRIVELHGTGNGLKLFEEGGDYQIAIVARNVAWELKISQLTKKQAAQIKRLTEHGPTLQDKARATLRLVREGTFSEWRPEGNDALLLFDSNNMGWRATFAQPCPGLESAKVISFVTPAVGSLEDYDSILLEDGTRCYFDRVVPTLLD